MKSKYLLQICLENWNAEIQTRTGNGRMPIVMEIESYTRGSTILFSFCANQLVKELKVGVYGQVDDKNKERE